MSLRVAPRLLWVAALLTALWSRPAGAIVGASAEGDRFAPYTVMVLQHAGSTAGFCTGVVLAQDVVLTAAHCVPSGAELRVHLPSSTDHPVLLPVSALAVHPDYRADAIRTRERSIDLALIRLARPLPSQFVPTTVARSVGVKLGQTFTVAGFGVTREGDASTSGRLRAVALAAHAPASNVLLWAVDPQGQGAGVCMGDSGGPVVTESASGVTALVVWSAGLKQSHCGAMTQAVWLWPERAWIDRVLQAWASSGDATAADKAH